MESIGLLTPTLPTATLLTWIPSPGPGPSSRPHRAVIDGLGAAAQEEVLVQQRR